MAMDALKNLSNNVPNWLNRLDELSGQIDQRQAELAAVALAEGKSPNAETRSLRNKGSTESLKPKDDPKPYPNGAPDAPAEDVIPEDAEPTNDPVAEPRSKSTTPPADIQPKSPTPVLLENSSAPKPTPEDVKAARAHVRVTVKRRQRSESMVSGENAVTPANRARTMIMVYYDSYVQGFFDDLVRFVSSSRNLMRKAKMAAKVAQIKKLAEMEVPDDDEGGDIARPSLRLINTRRFGAARGGFGPPGSNDPPDVYDNLDKGLEFVQNMCEHGAHQFLRDGDCNDEIVKAQKRLAEVLEMANKEMERIHREEPELAKEAGDMGKVRTRRPISMRRDMLAQKDGKDDGMAKIEADDSLSPMLPSLQPQDMSAPLLADPNVIEADEGIDVDMEAPKLEFRSARGMRRTRMP